MSINTIEVVEPGFLTTVQDKGRYNYQKLGVPVSGAMDVFSLRAANILVGNSDNEAALEMTVLGSKIKFLVETSIAITGADLSPTIDGIDVPLWHSIRVKKGSDLNFGHAKHGMRSYVALKGGIDVPMIMDSRSTYLKGMFGGLEGRTLKTGDVLKTFVLDHDINFEKRAMDSNQIPTFKESNLHVRVILGPQDKCFTPNGIKTFLNSEYLISMESDRMGYRLEGPKIEHVNGADIVSDGTPLGAIQVPGNGLPLILLADRGTTGGYTKLATVVSSDIGKLAQAMPGTTMTFESIEIEEAHNLIKEQENSLNSIHTILPPVKLEANQNILVNGEAYEVTDKKGRPIASSQIINKPSDTKKLGIRTTINNQVFDFNVDIKHGD